MAARRSSAAVTTRRSSAAVAARRSSAAAHPNDFAHPYLNAPAPLPKKREFGICNLFLFKICGCFSVDELPPPNFDAPVYQAGKSSSSNFTFKTNTTTTRTTSRANSPPKDAPHSPSLSTSTNTNSRASSSKRHFVGSTGVEDIPYRRPPTEAFKHRKPQMERPKLEKSTRQQRVRVNRVSEGWESRAPVELAESDEVETRWMAGNVSRLSSMFENG